MKHHQELFKRIKDFLTRHLNNLIEEHEEGSYLAIGDTGIWISCDERELTVGYGFSHRHYDPEYDNILEAITEFFDLLTKRKRVTEYYKGNFQYKYKTEIELEKDSFKYLGTSMTWLFPYWKRTTIKERFTDKVFDSSKVEHEIDEIKNYAQQAV